MRIGSILNFPRQRLHVLGMLTLVAAICPGVFGREFLTPVALGKSEIFSYGLYSIRTDTDTNSNMRFGPELLLVLRNAGAKFLDLANVSAEDFELRDEQDKPVKLLLSEKLRGLAFGEATIAHLRFENHGGLDAKRPWSLRFKSKPKAFVEFELLISNDGPKVKDR